MARESQFANHWPSRIKLFPRAAQGLFLGLCPCSQEYEDLFQINTFLKKQCAGMNPNFNFVFNGIFLLKDQ